MFNYFSNTLKRNHTMKNIALTALITASLSTGAAVAAEPFKDRGIDYRTTAQPSTSLQSEAVSAQANSFNDRGIDYVEAAPVDANTTRSDVSIAITGFNDRDHIALTDKRQNRSDDKGDERIGYAD
jgi:hypothetical protein